MKKYIATALTVLLLTAALYGCAAPAASGEDISMLTQKGLDYTAKMVQLASSESYVNALSTSEELKSAISKMKLADAPKAIYSAKVPSNKARELILNGAQTDLPSDVLSWIDGKACSSISGYLSARLGAATFAATSSMAYSSCFVCKALTEPTLYFYLYDSDYFVIVAFIPGQDGAVSGSAMFVPCDETLRNAADSGEVGAWFNEQLNYLELTVTAVELPQG